MKVLPINNNYSQAKNTNFKSANKFCKYSITSLIASSSLFMMSNAIDTYRSDKIGRNVTEKVNTVASILGIAGTVMGLFGIEKLDKEDSDEK
jgi:hypothetical protein